MLISIADAAYGLPRWPPPLRRLITPLLLPPFAADSAAITLEFTSPRCYCHLMPCHCSAATMLLFDDAAASYLPLRCCYTAMICRYADDDIC